MQSRSKLRALSLEAGRRDAVSEEVQYQIDYEDEDDDGDEEKEEEGAQVGTSDVQ